MKESRDPAATNGQQTRSLNAQNGNHPSESAIAKQTQVSAPQPQANDADNKMVRAEAFDQPVILKQTARWSHAIIISIISVTVITIILSLFKIEEAVQATGKLEPQAAVQEVDPPVNGVVEEVLVKDGDQVRRGDVLVRLEPDATESDKQQLEQNIDSLTKENQFYRAHLSGLSPEQIPSALDLELPPEVLLLASNRTELIEENSLYETLLTGADVASLTPSQRVRLSTLQSEANSRISSAGLEIEALRRQLRQTEGQIASAERTLAIEQEILDDITPLVEEGALSALQLRRQEVEALTREAELDRFMQERRVVESQIAQAQEQLTNTVALTRSDLLNRIAENDKRIAEIDSNLTQRIVTNDRQITELSSQLAQTELTLDYQEIEAPIDGIVFDLTAQEDGFININSQEPILKIVPSDALVARVFITNQDIGFVEEGMQADVRVDSFPFSEFGDVQGELVWIGSDALPPDQQENRPVYTFPARIELDQQFINANGRPVKLQSGMSTTVNIIIRKRRIITFFTDLFSQKADSIKTTR
ncbi:MAG: HlyD family efflux transporter periplasmic adaptor subunit [Leptolyngbyaceae bacterium]|nr:HlyD family efflux transporter periplasmic adaptor subunit [Leptolyngbyaceae bacterium]